MGRFLTRFGAQALLILSPILTLSWSLLNWLGHSRAGPKDIVTVGLGFLHLTGPKQEVEVQLRIGLSVCALLLVMGGELADLYLPQRNIKSFRAQFLKELGVDWRHEWGEDFRICIMHARRRWFFPFSRLFQWTWYDGFEPPIGHFDTRMILTEWQGVCGLAFRRQEAQWVDFRGKSFENLTFAERWLLRNRFHLWRWQLTKTRKLLAVLSVPMLYQLRTNGPWKSAGVFSLDAVTEKGAILLDKNKEALVEYFIGIGKIIAWLG
jgi:hypothetical protein